MSLANQEPLAEEAGQPAHKEPVVRLRVLYADTDAGGVVYNAAYLRFFEAARTEAMRAAGAPYTRLVEQGLHLPIVEQTVRYRTPAFYDDVLTVYVTVAELRRVQVAFDYDLRRESDGSLIVTGRTLHGCIDVARGRPAALPDWARESLRSLRGGAVRLDASSQ
jgi:acyl-CoA thioester hydrolase